MFIACSFDGDGERFPFQMETHRPGVGEADGVSATPIDYLYNSDLIQHQKGLSEAMNARYSSCAWRLSDRYGSTTGIDGRTESTDDQSGLVLAVVRL
jgi:hypothetical protein